MTIKPGRQVMRWTLRMLPLTSAHCTDEGVADLPLAGSTSEDTGSTGDDAPVPTTGQVEELGTSGTSTGEPDDGSTADASTMDASTTGPTEPGCGDGVVQGDEECDDGVVENMLDGSCLPTCVAARCGDGVVQTGVDECDFGDYNDYNYGGCIPKTCKWGPRCGDGDVDAPDEVCDPGDPNGQDSELVGCDASCRFKGRLVFLSSVGFTGNLGGLAGADALCRSLAANFDSTHADSYIAWLSDAKTSPLQRIPHGADYLEIPYVLRSGVQVAASFKDLVSNGPWPGINITDTYEVAVDVQVWTNTAIDGSGLPDVDYCAGWGSESADHSARVGRNWLQADSKDFDLWKLFGHWTSEKTTSCDVKRRLYCFEN